jgi:hypothetical protein
MIGKTSSSELNLKMIYIQPNVMFSKMSKQDLKFLHKDMVFRQDNVLELILLTLQLRLPTKVPSRANLNANIFVI